MRLLFYKSFTINSVEKGLHLFLFVLSYIVDKLQKEIMSKLRIILFLYIITGILYALSWKLNVYSDFLKDNKNTFIELSQMSTAEYNNHLDKKLTYEQLITLNKTRIKFLEHACLTYGYQDIIIYIYTDAEKRFCDEYRNTLSFYDIIQKVYDFEDSKILESDDFKESVSIISQTKQHEEFKAKARKLLIDLITPEFPNRFEPICEITDSVVGCFVSFDKHEIDELKFFTNIFLNQSDYNVSCEDESELTKCFIDSSKQFMKVRDFLSKTKNIDPSLSNTQFMLKLQDSY